MNLYGKLKSISLTTPKNNWPAIITIMVCMLVVGCKNGDKKPPKSTQPQTSQTTETPAPEPLNPKPILPAEGSDFHPAEEIQAGEQVVIQAVGRARKSKDPSVARETASNRAIHKIAGILKKKGYSVQVPDRLQDVTIQRIWSKGRYIYARAALPLSEFIQQNQINPLDQDKQMNVEATGASNHLENHKPSTTTSPEEGDKP